MRDLEIHYFTFGNGQALAGCCQPILSDSPENARKKMFEKYGNNWAFQYTEKEREQAESEGFAREELLVPLLAVKRKELVTNE